MENVSKNFRGNKKFYIMIDRDMINMTQYAFMFSKRSRAMLFQKFLKTNNIKWSNGWDIEWDLRWSENDFDRRFVKIERVGQRFALRTGFIDQFNFKELNLIPKNY